MCASVLGWSAAQADTRIFVIANQADGYGVDRCLARGERCGAPVAEAYCRAQAYRTAANFQKVDAGDVTGSVTGSATDAAPAACASGSCGEFVAITCER